MKLNEVVDPSMKLRLEISNLRAEHEAQRKIIKDLANEVGKLKRTMAALITKLGPKS